MALTEKQIIRSLDRLAKGWPKDLWLLQSGPRSLHLMRKVDGAAVLIDGDPDQDYIIESFSFDIDSGDW